MVEDCKGMAMLRAALSRVPSESALSRRLQNLVNGSCVAGVHLAVFVEPYLEAILDGRKTIESRFSANRCTPFQRVQAGDIILLKRSGGPVVGVAVAGDARYYEVDEERLDELRERFAEQLFALDDEFWEARRTKRFASLIEIEDRVGIGTVTVEKRDRRGWVTYVDGRQQCLGIVT